MLVAVVGVILLRTLVSSTLEMFHFESDFLCFCACGFVPCGNRSVEETESKQPCVSGGLRLQAATVRFWNQRRCSSSQTKPAALEASLRLPHHHHHHNHRQLPTPRRPSRPHLPPPATPTTSELPEPPPTTTITSELMRWESK